jgi:hypothetical protein
MTSSCCSCHHAVRTWPRWPPGPSNEAYLSCPHLEASPATTFRACSSPAPTRVKPQSAPAILSQESVHTTLSITHHTRKWPSTGTRTTHGPHHRPSSSPSSTLASTRTPWSLPCMCIGRLTRLLTGIAAAADDRCPPRRRSSPEPFPAKPTPPIDRGWVQTPP